jgi:hypothetical protein
MPPSESDRRVAATIRAIREDAAADGLYYRVWLHLCRKGLTSGRGDRAALAAEIQQIRRRAEGHLRRTQDR